MESIDNKNIRDILDKYFEALTTLEEEQQLRDYFEGEVGAEFAVYKPLFNCFSSERESVETITESIDFTVNDASLNNHFVNDAFLKRKSLKRPYFTVRWLSIAATAALVVFTFTLLHEKRDSLQLLVDGVAIKNSELAISMADTQLSRVNSMLGKYKQSNEQLGGLDRVGDAISPLTSMGKLLKQNVQGSRLNSNNRKNNDNITN